MRETKHTPGPWGSARIALRGFLVMTRGGYVVAEVRERGKGSDSGKGHGRETAANAALLAAAPDLLAACELAEATIVRLERHAPGSAGGTLDVMRAAIRRARGEA